MSPQADPIHDRKRRPRGRGAAVACDEVAAPLRAGMRARAIADACETMALPVVLLDRNGGVLHVGATAQPLLAGDMTVSAGHLVGRTPQANRAIESAVAAALDGVEAAKVTDPHQVGLDLVGLRLDDPSPYQMMGGLVVLRPRGAMVSGASLDRLQELLRAA